MNAQNLAKYKKLLLEKRAQILNRANSRFKEALSINQEDLVDESDHAAALIQQGMAMEVQERDRYVLREIDHALSKMEDGTYGICEESEEPIDEARLEAQPWTRYSVEEAERREQRAKRYVNQKGS
ncbi:MAG: TraR/DksA family transcriptional regulator [Proteobacteria bacterium]|nr:TraR/DksA family transcriptional regulator [Pseudomonadota bacterium]